MDSEELKAEIQDVLAALPAHTYPDILDYLKAVQKANPTGKSLQQELNKIMREDAPLLKRLVG